MNVLFLQQGLGYGGASQSLIQMQKAIRGKVNIRTILKKNKRLNQQLKHLLSASEDIVEMHIPGVHSYPEGISSEQEWRLVKQFQPEELVSYINKYQIDILHVNSSVFSSLYKYIKEHTQVKIITHVREVIPQASDMVTQFIIEQIRLYSDFIICIADEESIHFKDLANCQVLTNPVDTDYFHPNNKRENDPVVIGMMANFNPLKGHDTFIEVANKTSLLCKRNVRFELLGMPSSGLLSWKEWLPIKSLGYFQQVKAMIRNSGGAHLRVIPFQADVKPIIQNWHLALRMERSMKPWGRDVLECMAMGIPVIALGSSEVMIKNEETGWLVERNEVNLVVDQLIKCINDPEKMQRVATNARNWAVQNVGTSEYADSILKIYNDIQ